MFQHTRRVLLLLIAVSLTGAVAAQQSRSRVALDLGTVAVWLGMPKSEVLDQLTKAHYIVNPTEDGTAVFAISTMGSNEGVYHVRFKAGRVCYASREWYGGSKGTTSVMHAVIGALTVMDGQSCMVLHSPMQQPDFDGNRIFVICGQRRILLMEGKFKGAETIDVTEMIGSID